MRAKWCLLLAIAIPAVGTLECTDGPQIPLTPPLVTLARALEWRPLPLTIREGRRFARKAALLPAARSAACSPWTQRGRTPICGNTPSK